MSATTPLAVASAVLALALAGCTGGFQVDQTEPFRIQLEGAPETVTVRETDAEPQRIEVDTCGDAAEVEACAQEVEVQVEVEKVASGPCKILVTIQDENGQTLVSRVIDVDVNTDGDDDSDDGTTGNGTTTGNTTGNATMTTTAAYTGGSGQTVVQNIFVDVRGNRNIVVLTQAQQGTADVHIQAIKASGGADVDVGDDEDGTMTSSATMTTTAGNATTTTTGP